MGIFQVLNTTLIATILECQLNTKFIEKLNFMDKRLETQENKK